MNPNAFNRDTLLGDRIEALIKKKGIELVVETGSYQGTTSRALAEACPRVISIESNPTYHAALPSTPGVEFHLADSGQVLKSFTYPKTTLFFLDAHWGPNWPLREELAQIVDIETSPVILIHDFKVPGHPELGYDSYGDLHCDWDHVKDLIVGIYGVDKFTLTYPTEAHGSKRGWVLIEPL